MTSPKTEALRLVRALRLALVAACAVAAAGLPAASFSEPEFASVKPTPRVEHWQRRQAEINAQLRDAKTLAAVKLVLLAAAHERLPNARIVLQSLLPTNEDAKNASVVRPINRAIADLAATAPSAAFTTYLDLYPAFVDDRGVQIGRYFTDGLHPNLDGYRVWRDRLVPFLQAARVGVPR